MKKGTPNKIAIEMFGHPCHKLMVSGFSCCSCRCPCLSDKCALVIILRKRRTQNEDFMPILSIFAHFALWSDFTRRQFLSTVGIPSSATAHDYAEAVEKFPPRPRIAYPLVGFSLAAPLGLRTSLWSSLNRTCIIRIVSNDLSHV